ncbi:protein kinase [Modestobacter sp. NPDC049651]|uniref:serine/threonine-protein kinase n=1 Tax=unclassified Modestobacter TaxID=2643866 RepID=UPI0033E88E87
MPISVGSVLAGRYEVVAPIATGGMGEVWQARDRTLGRIIALKVLRTEYAGDTSFLIRFRNEARHTAGLSHPNIASVYDYGESQLDGQRLAYLVMEYVEGKPLVSLLAEFGRLTSEQTLDVLAQAGDGLSAAHEAGVVHRDIKPGNLLVRPDGVVKLTDFGIARARDAVPLTRTGMVVGTAQYLSPEQAQGFAVTPASDVYSLGVVGYECLAGVRPFDGESQVAIALAQINRPPPPLPADVPPAVRSLIERALAKNPAQRFTDGGAFADAVRDVAAGATVPSTAETAVVDPDSLGTTVLPVTGPGTAPRTGVRTGPRTTPPLPPLAGPPVDGGDQPGDDGFDGWDDDAADQRTRRRNRLIALAAVLAVLLVAGGVYVLVNSGNDGSSGSAAPPKPSSTRSIEAGDVLVDAAAYVGKPLDEVTDDLEAKKLVVTTEEAPDYLLVQLDADMPKGRVVTTDPFKQKVAEGSEVVVYFTASAYTTDDGADQSDQQEQTTAPVAPGQDGAPGNDVTNAPGTGSGATGSAPNGNNPGNGQSGSSTTTGTRPSDVKPSNPRPSNPKPSDPRPSDPKPSDPKPSDPVPSEETKTSDAPSASPSPSADQPSPDAAAGAAGKAQTADVVAVPAP